MVRIELDVELPRSTLNDLRLRDLLPAGMALRGDGDVRVSFVSDATITTESDLAAADNDADPASTPLAGVRVSEATLGDGTTELVFDLGDVTVGADGADGRSERVLISYAAVVTNTAAAQDGGGGSPAAEVLVAGEAAGEGNATNAVTLAYGEPAIADLVKTVSPSGGGDAGDTLAFEARFSNTGSEEAFEVTLVDLVGDPADLTLDTVGIAVTRRRHRGGLRQQLHRQPAVDRAHRPAARRARVARGRRHLHGHPQRRRRGDDNHRQRRRRHLEQPARRRHGRGAPTAPASRPRPRARPRASGPGPAA